jgi:outer membrane murein-binding lipoprotein Lpp
MIFSRLHLSLLAVAGLAGALLAGCVNNTALDDLRETKPTGSPFDKALFQDYSALARSFGEVGAAAGVSFDSEGSMELTSMDSKIGALANAFAEKALIAARGSVVEPEPGIDVPTHKMRDRLIRALERGRDTYPADAARAQAEYDCWMMNATVPAMAAASRRCLSGAEVAVAKLEGEAKPAPVAAPPSVPANSDQPAVSPSP